MIAILAGLLVLVVELLAAVQAGRWFGRRESEQRGDEE
jgi:hypothetical protein